MKVFRFLMPLWLFGVSSFAQQNGVPFNGSIVDEAGNPLKSVKVQVNDKNGRFTRSDKKGRFGLTDVAPGDTLLFIRKKECYKVAVGGRHSMKVQWLGSGQGSELKSEESLELVDFGYGYVRRREYTGSSTGVSGDVLRATGKQYLLDALQGKVAGLSIITSPMTGGKPQVQIRGQKTIMGDSTPLFILDGVQVEDFDGVNMQDVDYVEVLKEAGIYGSRGANGAIIVRTKR